MKMYSWIFFYCWTLCATAVIRLTAASEGDNDFFNIKCMGKCEETHCADLDLFHKRQPVAEWLLQWTCEEECEYTCMWETVDWFQQKEWKLPQFHGKWPFIRVLGVQEPASTIFSLLNGVSHVYMLSIFTKKVPSRAPMYYMWISIGMVSINAWIWSTVFHSRDTPLTEKMDYFSALGCVQYMLLVAITRFLRTKQKWIIISIFASLLAFFAQHVYYMAWVHFDYGYNMLVNVISGVVNSSIWLVWCVSVWRRQPYVWKAATVILITALLLTLELGDFPPLFWVFDAHSLWHGGTVLLPLLWYSFGIDDSLFLLEEIDSIPLRTKSD